MPYEQDMSAYPEVFKMYNENFERWDEIKNKFENEKPLREGPESHFERKIPKDQSPWEKKYDDFMPKFTGTSAQ